MSWTASARRTVAAALLCALVAAACRSGEVRVELIVPDRLESGEKFAARYETREGLDPRRLRPSVEVALKEGGEVRNYLLARGNPRIIPPERPLVLPAVELRGPGPYTLFLPDLEPGRYELCTSVGIAENDRDSQVESVEVCRQIEVVAPEQ